MTISIPCDTIARLSNLIDPEHEEPVFRRLRLDNGKVIATDRWFMAIENVGSWSGVYYLTPTDALVEQCRTEATLSGTVRITANDTLKYTTAMTGLGWSTKENIGYYPDAPTDYDHWYDRIIKKCLTPAPTSSGGMVWITDQLVRLSRSSPSGVLIFEQHIQAETRPTVVRDVNSPDWLGVLQPRLADGVHRSPATVPGWCKL